MACCSGTVYDGAAGGGLVLVLVLGLLMLLPVACQTPFAPQVSESLSAVRPD